MSRLLRVVVCVTFMILFLMPLVSCQEEPEPSEATETPAMPLPVTSSPVATQPPVTQPPVTTPPLTTTTTAGFPSQPVTVNPNSTLMGGTFTPTCHIICENVEPAAIATAGNSGRQKIVEVTGQTAGRFRRPFDRFRPFGMAGNLRNRFPQGPFAFPGFPFFDETTVDDPEFDDMAVIVKPARQANRQPQTDQDAALGMTDKLYKCKKICT